MFCLHRASFLYGPWGCPSSWSQHIIHGIYTFYFWSGNFQGRSWVRSRLLWKILTSMVRPDLAKNLLVNLRHSGKPPFSSRLLWFHLCYSMISCALRMIPRSCTYGKTKCVQIDNSQVPSQNWNIFHRFCRTFCRIWNTFTKSVFVHLCVYLWTWRDLSLVQLSPVTSYQSRIIIQPKKLDGLGPVDNRPSTE